MTGPGAMGVPAVWEAAVVIPFCYPRTLPTPNEAEDRDHRLHIDAWEHGKPPMVGALAPHS